MNLDKEWSLKVDETLTIDWVRAKDLDGPWLHWLKNPKVVEWLEGPRLNAYTVKKLREYYNHYGFEGSNPENFKLLAIRYQGLHIGNLTVSDIQEAHSHATLGIVIGDPTVWGKGIARKTLQVLSDWLLAPSGGNLIRLQAAAFSANPASAKAFEAAGFEKEGLFRKARCLYGEFYDLIWMARIRN